MVIGGGSVGDNTATAACVDVGSIGTVVSVRGEASIANANTPTTAIVSSPATCVREADGRCRGRTAMLVYLRADRRAIGSNNTIFSTVKSKAA